jgi:hypothetical protein
MYRLRRPGRKAVLLSQPRQLYRLRRRSTPVLLCLSVCREEALHLVNGQTQAVQERQGGRTPAGGRQW